MRHGLAVIAIWIIIFLACVSLWYWKLSVFASNESVPMRLMFKTCAVAIACTAFGIRREELIKSHPSGTYPTTLLLALVVYTSAIISTMLFNSDVDTRLYVLSSSVIYGGFLSYCIVHRQP